MILDWETWGLWHLSDLFFIGTYFVLEGPPRCWLLQGCTPCQRWLGFSHRDAWASQSGLHYLHVRFSQPHSDVFIFFSSHIGSIYRHAMQIGDFGGFFLSLPLRIRVTSEVDLPSDYADLRTFNIH